MSLSTGLGARRALALGAADWGLPTGISASGQLGLSVQAVLNDPSIANATSSATGLPVLSPFSVINLSMLQTIGSSYLEQPLESAASALVAALPSSMMGSVADAMGAVFDAVPFIGAFVGVITKVVGMILDEGAQRQAQMDQLEAAWCQRYLGAFTVPAGGGPLDLCQTCPADIFYPSVVMRADCHWTWLGMDKCARFGVSCPYPCDVPHPDPAILDTAPPCYADNYFSPNPGGVEWARLGPNGEANYPWRPALGQGLMKATEGATIDAFEIKDPIERDQWSAFVARSYEGLRVGFAAQLASIGQADYAVWWGAYGGIPYPRRQQFMALRRAIQATNKGYGHLSDAGMSLWPVYMDLLVDAYDTNVITDDFIEYMIAHDYYDSCPGVLTVSSGIMNMYQDDPWSVGIGPTPSHRACSRAIAQQIRKLVDEWRTAVRAPATAQGARNLQSYIQKAQKAALAAARGSKRRTVSIAQPKSFRPIPRKAPPSKFHPSAAVLGAGAAAAVLYFFL